MKPDNLCPQCRKIYDHPPTRCVCGWYLTREQAPEKLIDRLKCHYLLGGAQCNELGRISISTRSNEWYCSLHAEELREKSYQH